MEKQRLTSVALSEKLSVAQKKINFLDKELNKRKQTSTLTPITAQKSHSVSNWHMADNFARSTEEIGKTTVTARTQAVNFKNSNFSAEDNHKSETSLINAAIQDSSSGTIKMNARRR